MLRPLAALLTDATRLYFKHFKHLSRYVLLWFLPTATLFAIGLISLPLAMAFATFDAISNWLILAVLLIGIAFQVWMVPTLMAAVATIGSEQQPLPLAQALALGWRFIVPMTGTAILVMLALAFGTLLFFIPGIIFGVWYLFSGWVVLKENKSGLAALAQSQELVIHRWWKILWRALVPFSISLGMAFSLSVIILYALALTTSPLMMRVFDHLVITLVFAFITPWWLLSLFLLYSDARREGPSVAA